MTIKSTKSAVNQLSSYLNHKKSEYYDNSQLMYHTSSSDIMSALHQLKLLYEEETISKEEFELKKAQLLRRF